MKTKIFNIQKYFFIVSGFLLIILTLESCNTTYHWQSEYVPQGKLLVDNISYIILKNGNFIKAQDYTIKYFDEYEGKQNVYVAKHKYSVKDIIISSDDIKEVYLYKEDFDFGKTAALGVGTVIGAGLVFFGGLIIVIAIANRH